MTETSLTRREFLKTSAGIGLLAFSHYPKKTYAKETDSVLRIGYLPITDASPLLIGHAKGFFQEEGLNVMPPIMLRTWSMLSESFLSGKFDVTHMLMPMPIWMRFKNNLPVKILAWDHTNGSAITVKADSHIQTFKDLGGKQIAVPYWYSMHNIILQMALKKDGIQPVIQNQSMPLKPNQANLFILPPPEMPVALAGNKIDSFIVAEPYNALAEQKLNAKILRFTGDIWKDHPCCVVVMNEHDCQTRPEFTQKVINGIVKSQLWIQQNRNETAKVLGKEGGGYLPVPEHVLQRVFNGYELSKYGGNMIPQAIKHPEWHNNRIGFQPYPYPSATEFLIREMKHTLMEGDTIFLKNIDPITATKSIVDDSFVKNAIKQIGGLNMFYSDDTTATGFVREEIVDL